MALDWEQMFLLVALFLGLALGFALVLRWGARWGATEEELVASMAGDDWLEGVRPARVVMTRAVTIAAAPNEVWPWLAQLGRGAGWYALDLLDNGGRPSARHVVSWIPAPALGDATAIGYLRRLEPGRVLAWWQPEAPLAGAGTRAVFCYEIEPRGAGTRLVARFSWDARGVTGWPVLLFFQAVDTVMALKQMLGIKRRAELYGARGANPAAPETGARDQFQLYQVVYACGEVAGERGRDLGAKWHRAAIRDGVLPSD